MFKDNQSLSHYKRINEEFKITELVIHGILCRYDKYEVIHSPLFKDLRSFSWHNYHDKEEGVFNNELNYTAILSIKGLSTESIISKFSNNRKREYKRKLDVLIKESDDIEVLDNLHRLTFERQEIHRSSEESVMLKNIAYSALKNGFGRLVICYKDDIAISATLFLHDNQRAYYLFGANHPEYRNTGSSTHVMINNILYYQNLGLKEIDFVGANSPQRGDYKISFNADIIPYYRCIFEK